MPTDFEVAYKAWLAAANPAKATRLPIIVAAMVKAVRGAVSAQLGYDPVPDETMVPTHGRDHTENLVLFKLGMEMGLSFAPQVYNLFTQANIWLRMVASGAIKIDVGGAVGTPSYVARVRRERFLA